MTPTTFLTPTTDPTVDRPGRTARLGRRRAASSTPSTGVDPRDAPRPAPDGPALLLEGVEQRYGDVEVLHGIDLRVQPGELVALVGPSGSGKTSLLAIAGGLLRPTGGAVRVATRDLYDHKGAVVDVARDASFILQAASTIPFLTVEENLLVRRIVRRERVTAEDLDRARALLTRVDLDDQRGRLPNELSGGERQRVCVAAALVTRAPLVLADEPTASLDRVRGRAVMELLAEHAHTEGAAVVAATHDERSLDLADRVVRIEDGRLDG